MAMVQPNLNNLPVEMITWIFDFLNIDPRKQASTVCTELRDKLLTPYFKRQSYIAIHSDFKDQMGDMEKDIIRSYCDLRIYHLYNEDESDILVKYLYQPTPEQNIINLLFDDELELDELESLEIHTNFDSCRVIFEDRLERFSNLKQLSLIIEKVKGYRKPGPTNWIIQHDRIESLSLQFPLYGSNTIQIDMQNLVDLDLSIECTWLEQIVEKYCKQLHFLRVQLPNTSVNKLLSLSFPRLIHLNIMMYFRSQMDDDAENAQKDEKLFKGMPKLKTLFLKENILFYRLIEPLANFANNLEELTLYDQQIEYAQFRIIEALPKLKSLSLNHCKILMSTEPSININMPHLEKLELRYNYSCFKFDNILSGLKVLKLIYRDNPGVMHEICNNLPNLEYLELQIDQELEDTAFQYLNKLKNLKSIKIVATKLSALLWQQCLEKLSVQKLVFTRCALQMDVLRPLANLFPALKMLYFDYCHFIVCDGESTVECDADYGSKEANINFRIEYLRKLFPSCRVSINEPFFMQRLF